MAKSTIHYSNGHKDVAEEDNFGSEKSHDDELRSLGNKIDELANCVSIGLSDLDRGLIPTEIPLPSDDDGDVVMGGENAHLKRKIVLEDEE